MEIKPKITPIELNPDSYTQITVDRAGSVLLQLRESTIDIYLAESDNPVNEYFTLKAGGSLSLDISVKEFTGLYAKSQAGTPTLELMWLKQE